MASNKKTSSTFRLIMLLLISVMGLILFFGLKENNKTKRVEKPVTITKAVVRNGVASRVVRNSVVENDSSSNGSITMKLDLGDLGFDLKNSK